jgi:protein-disulfide isomerase
MLAECAGRQGKFWEMHEKLFDKQQEWPNAEDPWKLFEGYAKELGVDWKSVQGCVNDGKTMEAIEKDVNEGNAWEVQSTPTLFIGHRRLVGGRQMQELGPGIIDKLLK